MDRDEEQRKRRRGDNWSLKSAGRPCDPIHRYFTARSDGAVLECIFCKNAVRSSRVSYALIAHLLQCRAARGIIDLKTLAGHKSLEDILEDGQVDDREKALIICACVIVDSAVSVALLDSKYFRMLWNFLTDKDRAANVRVPPTREQIFGSGLTRLVRLYHRNMHDALAREPLTIEFGACKMPFGRLVYAFVAVTGRGHAFLLHAADMSGKKDGARTLLSEIRNSTGDFPADLVQCIVSDGARNSLSARTSFISEHTHVQSFSCIAHVINLIFNDAYKLDGLQRVATTVQSVLDSFEQSGKLKAGLESFYRHFGISVPGKLAQERFAPIYTGSKSLLDNKRGLQHLAASGSFATDHVIATALADNVFWRDLESSISLLKPLHDLLRKSESTCYSPGQAFRDCIDMVYLLVEAIRADQSLPKGCFTGLLEILRKRLYPLQDKPLFAFAACLLPDQSNLPWKDEAFERLADFYRSYLSAMEIKDERLQANRQMFLTYIKKHQRGCNARNSSYLGYWKHELKAKNYMALPRAAMALGSMTINSISCERVFALLRRLDKSSHNKMSVDTLLNMAKAHLYLQRCEGAPDPHAGDSWVAHNDQFVDEDSDGECFDTETASGEASAVNLASFADVCSLFPNLRENLEVSSPSLVCHLVAKASDDVSSSSESGFGLFGTYF